MKLSYLMIVSVVILLQQLSGGVNALGWSSVVISLLLALGFAYFQFMRPSAAVRT